MARNLENVKISVMTRFASQLAGVSSVDYEGTNFKTKDLTEWLEPRVIGPVANPARKGERDEAWFLNVNCYARTGFTSAGVQKENTNRTWELADSVLDVFNQADLNLQDWGAGGDPVIGVIRFEEGSANAILGAVKKTDLQQVNVTISFSVIL